MPREVKGLETAQIGDVVEAVREFDYEGMTVRKGERGTVVDRRGERDLYDGGDEVWIMLHEHHCELHQWESKMLIHLADVDLFPMKVVWVRSADAA